MVYTFLNWTFLMLWLYFSYSPLHCLIFTSCFFAYSQKSLLFVPFGSIPLCQTFYVCFFNTISLIVFLFHLPFAYAGSLACPSIQLLHIQAHTYIKGRNLETWPPSPTIAHILEIHSMIQKINKIRQFKCLRVYTSI